VSILLAVTLTFWIVLLVAVIIAHKNGRL